VLPSSATLAEVSAEAERSVGLPALQENLAELITGARMRATPALTALCGVVGGRVLTTNYENAIELSAESRGLKPISLLPTQVQILEDPGEDEVQVIHINGMPSDPSSLVLPGRGMNHLVSDSTFARFVSATMAPRNVLYLGFSFGIAELHLLAILSWLSTEVDGAREHYLLLPAEEVRARKAEMAVFAGFGFVNVVAYEADESHTAVERIAVALAPRAIARDSDDHGPWRARPTSVQPIMVRAEATDDHEILQQRVASFDYGWSDGKTIATPEQVLAVERALVVGAPGMGKTTLVNHLPPLAEGRLCAVGELGNLVPARDGDSPEQAIARILHLVEDGQRIAMEDLSRGDAVLLLDGLDEVEEPLRELAAAAIVAAVSSWPGHHWVVTSRPTAATAVLEDARFERFHILPSRRWARKYLETRGVPPHRVEQAMLDGYGLGDLLGVPLFAERLADRLLDGDVKNLSPLELLVDEQYAATRREARKQGEETADLGGWMRSLAVALELRGRSSATIGELASIVGLAASPRARHASDSSTPAYWPTSPGPRHSR
jgi:SIR2-like domain